MALILGSAAVDALERRLRDPQGAPPSAAEIEAAVSASAGGGRRAARLKAWAVAALQRVSATGAQYISMADAADRSARSGQ